MAQIRNGTRYACDLLYLGPNPHSPCALHTDLMPLFVRTQPRVTRMYLEKERLYTCARLPAKTAMNAS
jgi:hypothetical protein